MAGLDREYITGVRGIFPSTPFFIVPNENMQGFVN